jgi:hypothetical protein
MDGSPFIQGFSWGDIIQWGAGSGSKQTPPPQTPRSQTRGPDNEEVLQALRQIQNVLIRGFEETSSRRNEGRASANESFASAATPGARSGGAQGGSDRQNDPLIDPLKHYGQYVNAARRYEDVLGVSAELREKISSTLSKSAEDLSDEEFFAEVDNIKQTLAEYDVPLDQDEEPTREAHLDQIREGLEELSGLFSGDESEGLGLFYKTMKEKFEELNNTAEELSDPEFTREVETIKQLLATENVFVGREETSREEVSREETLEKVRTATESLREKFSEISQEKSQLFRTFEESLSGSTQEAFEQIRFALAATNNEEQENIAQATPTPDLIRNIREGHPNTASMGITEALSDAGLTINRQGEARFSREDRDPREPEVAREQVSKMSAEEIISKIEEFGGEGMVESFRQALVPIMTQVGNDVRSTLMEIQESMIESREQERQRLAASSVEEKNAVLRQMQERGQLAPTEAMNLASLSSEEVFGPARAVAPTEVLPTMATPIAAYSVGNEVEKQYQAEAQAAKDEGRPVDTTGMPLWMQAQLGLQAVGIGGAAAGIGGAASAMGTTGATGAGVATAEAAGAGGLANKLAGMKGSPILALGTGLAGMAASTLTPGGGMSGQQISQGITGQAGTMGAGAGMLLASPLGVGALPAAAVGYVAGNALGGVANKVMSPYFDYVGQQAQYEAVTGEEMGTSITGMPGDVMYGADTIQGQINSARMQHMFTPVEQIEAMTDQMLEMGLSTEEAANSIGPLTDVLADLRVSPEFLATIRATSGAEVQARGLDPNVYTQEIAQQVRDIATETGMPQSQVEQTVAEITQATQGVYGPEGATQIGLTADRILGAGDPAQQQMFKQWGTAGNLAAPPADLMDAAMLGMDPMMDMGSDRYQEELLTSKSQVVDRFFDNWTDPQTGEPMNNQAAREWWGIDTQARATGLSFDEAYQMAMTAHEKGTTSANIAKKSGDKSKTAMQETRERTDQRAVAAARGEGGGNWNRMRSDLVSLIPGMGVNRGQLDPGSDLHEIAFGARGTNIKGAAHLQGLAKREDIDPSKISIGKVDGKKMSLGEALDSGDKDLIENITQGRKKAIFKGEKYAVSEISALLGTEQLTVDQQSGKLVSPTKRAPDHPNIGGVGLPKKGPDGSRDSNVKHEISLSKEAARLFNIKELSDSSGMPGQVSDQLQKWSKAIKNSPLNDIPILGR